MPRLSVIPGGRAGEPSGPSSPAAGSQPGGSTSSGTAARAGAGGSAAGRGGNTVEELYVRHAAMVLVRCRYLLREEEAARDATQEVFARVLRAADELRAARSPTAYLMRSATHQCLNVLRARRAAWRDEVKELARDRSERGIQPDAREMVRALLSVAPVEAREVAVLYFVDEMTQAEIAAETGRSVPTVRKRLREFLGAARGALAEAMPAVVLPDPDPGDPEEEP